MRVELHHGRMPARVRARRIVPVLMLAALSACSPKPDSEQAAKLQEAHARIASLEAELSTLRNAPSAPAAAAPSEASASPAAASNPPAAAATQGQQWRYRIDEEEMTNGKRKTASVESTNTVEFGFPYAGAQNGRLTLRTDPRYGKDVIFMIERGQILCPSYDGCTVQVRFDDDKPTSFSASAAADHSSEVIFLSDYSRFLTRMKKAKRVRLSVGIYQNGRPVFDFDVSGFDTDKYLAKS